MSLYEKHFDEELHKWYIFNDKQAHIINKLTYYAISIEWYMDWWEDKFGENKLKWMIVTGTILFFLYLPITFALAGITAILGLLFLIKNKLTKRKIKSTKKI